MKSCEILNTRKSVHTFTGETATEELWQKIKKTIEVADSAPGILNYVTRLTLADKGLGGSAFSGELGWIVGSMFIPKDEKKKNLYQIDLAFRLFKLSVELRKIGISTCITSYSFDKEKALEKCKDLHTMEFDAPLAMCFGFESGRGSLLSKFSGWFSHDSKRLPVDQIIENYKTSQISEKQKELLSIASKAPSIGNSQTWRVTVENGKVSFYVVSDLQEKYFNVGCFMAAYEIAAKEMKFKGSWNISDHTEIDAEYCLTYV